jgi:hypothetical protein
VDLFVAVYGAESMRGLLKTMSVRVILNDRVGLLGAARHALAEGGGKGP